MMKLTPDQRIKVASVVAGDKSLGGLRIDGTMSLETALKFCHAAKNQVMLTREYIQFLGSLA